MQFPAGVQRAWMEGGAKTVLTRSFRKVVRPAFKIGSLVFIECDLLKPMPQRRNVPGIVLREAGIEDANLFADRDLFFERLNDGHRCFMGIEEASGKLTNYRWVSTAPAYIPELWRYLLLKPGEAYVYDLKTLPEFRRRGIDAYTRHCVYTYLRNTGHTKVYAYIHGDNQPSLKASQILLKPLGRVWYVQIRGRAPRMIGGRKADFPALVRVGETGRI
jgi:ribosomal protein S18 acetylase RimI-like enzyme